MKNDPNALAAAYAVIVGDTLPLVLSQLILPNNLLYPIISSRRTMITLCTLFISLPLSLYRDISALAKTSAVSLLAIVFIVFSVVISGPFLPAEFKGSREGAITFLKPGVFQAIGVISFGALFDVQVVGPHILYVHAHRVSVISIRLPS